MVASPLGYTANPPLSTPTPFPTATIDGIPVFDGSCEAAIKACVHLATTKAGGRVATANLDFLAIARRDARLRSLLRESSLVIADGMPVVWLAKLAGSQAMQRLAGVDLVRELASRPIEDGETRVAFYGSTPEVMSAAVGRLGELAPTMLAVAAITPPFRPLEAEEASEYRAQITASRPHYVFVALGCPAQERLIAEWFAAAPQAVWVGIGGTLDFYAGKRKRAPRLAQAFGFEWLVRLAQEPRRLAGRYLVCDLPVLVRILPGALKLRFVRG